MTIFVEWTTRKECHIKWDRESILELIGSLEIIPESRPLTDEQLVKAHLAMEYEEVARNEEIFWR